MEGGTEGKEKRRREWVGESFWRRQRPQVFYVAPTISGREERGNAGEGVGGGKRKEDEESTVHPTHPTPTYKHE